MEIQTVSENGEKKIRNIKPPQNWEIFKKMENFCKPEQRRAIGSAEFCKNYKLLKKLRIHWKFWKFPSVFDNASYQFNKY